MPRYRTLPPAFGMPRRRTRLGRNVRFRSVLRVSARNASAPPRRCSMWYLVSPSTPAVREPLLLLTWSQATVSVAWWHTRLKRSSNLLLGSFFAHWCNFVWIWSTHARASLRLMPGASLFRADASPAREEVLITGPLRHVAGFPDLGLLRDLRHVAHASGDVDPARSASTDDGRMSDASHVHHVPLVGVVSSFAPAASSPAHRSSAGDLRAPILCGHAELESHHRRHPTHCLGPDQPGLEPLTNRGGSATGSLALHRPTLLARLRRLVVPPSRYVVRAAPAHHGNSHGRLPSASPNRCGGQGWVS